MITAKDIYLLRRKYFNKDIFILGSAPSIKLENLSLLRDKYTFGINSSTILANENNFIQTFYISTDDKKEDQLLKQVYNKYTIWDCGSILLNNNTIRFMPNFIEKYDTTDDKNRTFYYKLLGSVNEDVFVNSFSKDITKHVYRYYYTPSAAIQIAIFLGFKNIFILGVDLIYPKSGTHFYNDSSLQYNADELLKLGQADRFCEWVYNASKIVYKNGQMIYSCSKYSILNNLIEYIPFSKAIKCNN